MRILRSIRLDDLRGEDAGQLLLEQVVDRDLVVCGDGGIDIIARLRLGFRDDLEDRADGVQVHLAVALLALQLGLHALLETPDTDGVVQLVALIGLSELRELVLPDLTGIADDVAQVRRIVVLSHGNIFDIDALQLPLRLEDLRHALLRHVLYDGRGLVALVGGETHGEENIDHVEGGLVIEDDSHAVFILDVIEAVTTLRGVEGLPCTDVKVLLAEVGDIAPADVRDETLPVIFRARRELKFMILIEPDLILSVDGIAVLLDDLRQVIQHQIPAVDALIRRVVGPVVGDRDVVLKLVIREETTVAVIDIAPRTDRGHLRQGTVLIIREILITVHDLELEQATREHGKQDRENQP